MSSRVPVAADESVALRPAARLRLLVVTGSILGVVLVPAFRRVPHHPASLQWAEVGLASAIRQVPGSSAIQKLGARDRAEAVERAQRKGWL